MNTNDGGPAFPVIGVPNACDCPGMSLRDWLAGQALSGYIASFSGPDVGVPEPKYTAKQVWDFAEAMMAERERRYGKPEQAIEAEAEVEGSAF